MTMIGTINMPSDLCRDTLVHWDIMDRPYCVMVVLLCMTLEKQAGDNSCTGLVHAYNLITGIPVITGLCGLQ